MDNFCWNIVFGFHGLYFSWSGTKCSTKKNNFKKKELCLTLMLIARHGGQFTTSDNIRRRDECWNPGGAPGPDRFWHFDKPTLETTSCYKQVGDWKSLWMSTIGLCTEQRLQFVCRKNSAASPKAGPPTSVQANVKSKSQPFQPLSYRVSTFHFRSSHSHRFPFKQVAHPLQKCFFALCLIQDVDAHGKHKMASSEFLKVNSTCIWWIWCIQTCVECSHSFSC